MTFKIKDLMINDLSSGAQRAPEVHALCGVHQVSCIEHTRVVSPVCKNGCTNAATPPGPREAEYARFNYCALNTLVCAPCTWIGTLVPLRQLPDVTTLSALKEQLKEQLAQVERQEAATEQGLLPQTVEEVDTLTKKLQEALDELKARRAELSK